MPGWLAADVQADGVCIAHIDHSGAGKPVIEYAGFFSKGAASIPDLLARLAKELRLAQYQCTTLLAPVEYQLLSVDAPNVPPEELKTAIRWRLKDLLDFHVDDATIDVLNVPFDKSSLRTHSMYAVAARNQIIEQKQRLFVDAKIPLRVIDIPEMAQRNIAALLETDGRGIAFLSFDESGGLLTVSYTKELYMARRIDISLSHLQRQNEEMQALHERVTLEVQRSLDHFDRQYHFIPLSTLVILPVGENTEALRASLAAGLNVSVETFDMEAAFDMSKVPALKTQEAQQRYFFTLGAALRHEEKTL
ncbi:MAG TPA: agglutinin biogenesis protein MshI [Noviherbaspirillum sp.]|nr:agglutinin biogenesis protein MshI [Noviherbaspirillum sp.]